MKITLTLDLAERNTASVPTQEGIQENIDAIDRAIERKQKVVDTNYLMDTKYILIAIQKQLPHRSPRPIP